MASTENTSKLTINGNYAIVKYELGWTLRDLLQIYGIPEKRTDLVRSVLKGNDLAYSNNVLTLANGSPIPLGKIIQMPTRVVSPSVLGKIQGGRKEPAANAKTAPTAPLPQAGNGSGDVLHTLHLLMQDKTTRWMVYGGAAALAIALVTGVTLALVGGPDAEGSAQRRARNTQPRSADSTSMYSIDTPRRSVDSEPSGARSTASIAAPGPTATPAAARNSAPASATAGTVSLEPGQKIDMRNVGTLEISQNSSKEEIVRVIQAFNELHSPKKK